MILTRIALNPFHARTYALVGDPYLFHQRLCRCFQSARQGVDLLFRIEEGPVVLLQSNAEADWSLLGEPREVFKSSPQSKAFDPHFQIGQRLSFRIRCRPTKKSKVEGSKNSRFRYLRSEEERLAWLHRQAERCGFRLESVIATEERWQDTKPTRHSMGEHSSSEQPARRRSTSLPATRFDGVLVVTDPESLREAVRAGIGPQKAYGFGLLSLGRAE